jgi:hypothetical protein
MAVRQLEVFCFETPLAAPVRFFYVGTTFVKERSFTQPRKFKKETSKMSVSLGCYNNELP